MNVARSSRIAFSLLLCCAAIATRAQPLKESWDGGKTWHAEGSYRPNRAAPPQPPSPAEIARQQAAAAEAQQHNEANTANDRGLEAQKRGDLAEAQRLFEEALAKWDNPTIRQNFANNTNKLAIEAQQRGDLATAERRFEQALVKWDHPVIRQNLESVRAQAQERRREQQEWHDAPVVAKMHAQLQQLGAQLGAGGGKLDFDGGSFGESTALPSGLDFVGLPAKSPAPGAGLTVAGDLGDASVVDLSGAKTLVLDPAKVKGIDAADGERLRDAPNAMRRNAAATPSTENPLQDPLFAAVVRDATRRELESAKGAAAEAQRAADDALLAAMLIDDKQAEQSSNEAWVRLTKAEQVVRDLRTQQHSLEHEQLMSDMKRIREDPALAAELDAALLRIRREELEQLKMPSSPDHAKLALRMELKQLQDAGVFRDSTDLLARAQTDPRVRAALDRAHAVVMHDQADVLRDSTDDVTRVVQRLKQKLPAADSAASPRPPPAPSASDNQETSKPKQTTGNPRPAASEAQADEATLGGTE